MSIYDNYPTQPLATIPVSTEVKAATLAAKKGAYVRLRDARDGGYKIRVVAGKHVNSSFHVVTVNEDYVILSGRVPVKVYLEEITLLIEDEADKAINLKLDKGEL